MSFGLVEKDAAYTSASTQTAVSTTLAKQFTVNFSPLLSYDLITLAHADFRSYTRSARGNARGAFFCDNNKRYYLPPINPSVYAMDTWELYLPDSSTNGNWVEFVFLCRARTIEDWVTILGPSTYKKRYDGAPFAYVISGMVIQNDVPTYYENVSDIVIRYGVELDGNIPTNVACNIKCVFANGKWIVSGIMHWANV